MPWVAYPYPHLKYTHTYLYLPKWQEFQVGLEGGKNYWGGSVLQFCLGITLCGKPWTPSSPGPCFHFWFWDSLCLFSFVWSWGFCDIILGMKTLEKDGINWIFKIYSQQFTVSLHFYWPYRASKWVMNVCLNCLYQICISPCYRVRGRGCQH